MKAPFVLLIALLFIILPTLGAAQTGPGPFTLRLGSWVCKTPEAYDSAISQQKQEPNVWKLSKQLFDEGSCIYMDDDTLEDMLAPYVVPHEQQGDKTKVSFFIEFYKRVAMLHRKIQQVKFIGWTDTNNIVKHRQAD